MGRFYRHAVRLADARPARYDACDGIKSKQRGRLDHPLRLPKTKESGPGAPDINQYVENNSTHIFFTDLIGKQKSHTAG
jgi:hypothetical protein